jgi:pimeloyl-ACP methyl ester carboxylesterase
VRRVPVARDVRLEVLDWGGTGPALVFLAGLGNTAHVYDDFAPRFRDQYHVYAVTRRGFGASSAPAGGYDAATRARDVVTVLDSLHVDRAALAGHSIAGDELSAVGAAYPGRVRALVYLDAYDYGPERLAAQSAFMQHLPAGLLGAMTAGDSASPAAVAAWTSRNLLGGAPIPEAEVRAGADFGPDGRLLRFRPSEEAKVLAGTQPSSFARISAAALGIFATYPEGPAQLFPLAYARFDSTDRARMARFYDGIIAWVQLGRERFRTELADGTVVELPGANHYVFQSRPEQVEREMRAFLARSR